MNTIRLESGSFGWDYLIINQETGEDILVQTDWDYPGLARSFGFSGLCECGSSDGTVDCPCATVSEHTTAAQEWLDENIGAVVADPGYFS